MSDQSLAVRQALGVERLGEIMYKSGYWQDTGSQAQAIVKILAGAELDFGPIASMNGVYIIDGRTTLSANLVGAAIQRSGRYRYRVMEHDTTHCTIDFYEVAGWKREKIGSSTFSIDDAKAAGLMGKRGGNWERYPRNMVFSRALTNGARWYTPDVFNGPVYTPDELGAELDAEGNVVEVTEQSPPPAAAPRAGLARDVMVTSADDRVWQRWLEVLAEGQKWGCNPPTLSLPIGRNQLVANATAVKAAVAARQEQLAQEDNERAAGRTEREAPTADEELRAAQDDHPVAVTQLGDAWARNRALQAEAYAAGLRVGDLPHNASLDEVLDRNRDLLQRLAR